ncbi:MAG: MoaD/ThiS family protein [Candidatus Nanopelagicales bacterium]|jgi:molybdopterin synthase sulfur carrier subunit
MTASVRIPTILRTYTGGAAEVSVSGSTLRESIGDLDAQFPGIAARVLNDDGALRRFVNVYVNDDDVRFLDSLDTPILEGAQISIIPAVAGGA